MKDRLALRRAALNHIVCATGFDEGQLETIVRELQEMGWDKNRIYQELMKGDGAPKSHASAFKDSDKIKNGAARHTRKHPR